MIRKRVIVRGQVQGVGFRWAAQAEAEHLAVCGYVRNLPDGTVQAEVEGTEPAVQRMLDWLRHGPPYARVDAVDIAGIDPENTAQDNTVRDGRFRII
ncbi:MAG: acylphosphatase [Homoserinimonas sp.]